MAFSPWFWRWLTAAIFLIVLVKPGQAPSETASESRDSGIPLSWTIAGFTILVIAALAVLEKIYLMRKKKQIPGPRMLLPFIGESLHMLRHPYQFWMREHERAKSTGISWNYLFGKFTMLCTKAKYARVPFMQNSEAEFVTALHPNAAAVFNEKSMILMPSGPRHTAMRRSFIKLFSRKSVSMYLTIQDKVAREYMQKWNNRAGEELDLRDHLREFNAKSSQSAFVGPFLKDPDHFQELMYIMGQGFRGVPISLPGTRVWQTNRAREEVEKILEVAVKESKEKIRNGVEPDCLLDFWTLNIADELAEAEQNDQPPPWYASDFMMTITIMDFLFAAQDASTCSLAQCVALMSDYPDILAKVRKEQEEVNPNDETITYEMLSDMQYTRQVAKEILRFRPPLPWFAHVPAKDIEIEDGYVVPKGTYFFSSIISTCREGFADPEKFDPDRFGPERQEQVKHCKNYLVFGAGPHRCAGREYAVNHMIVFLAILSTSCTWKRRRTPKSDESEYLPTAYPADLLITFD